MAAWLPVPQTFTVPLHCPRCRRPLSVVLYIPPYFEAGPEPVVQTIACPYPGCDGEFHPRLHATVTDTWAGQGEPPDPSAATGS